MGNDILTVYIIYKLYTHHCHIIYNMLTIYPIICNPYLGIYAKIITCKFIKLYFALGMQ